MGLLRTVGRTAAIAGTATAVSGRVARRQAKRAQDESQTTQAQPAYSQPAPAPAAPPAATSQDAIIEQLSKLADLKAAGVLTDAEFQTQKARILGS